MKHNFVAVKVAEHSLRVNYKFIPLVMIVSARRGCGNIWPR